MLVLSWGCGNRSDGTKESPFSGNHSSRGKNAGAEQEENGFMVVENALKPSNHTEFAVNTL